jgi:hypothetical protein
MSASACAPRPAVGQVAPSARLYEMVVASSPSWWLTEVGVERSAKRRWPTAAPWWWRVVLTAPGRWRRRAGRGWRGCAGAAVVRCVLRRARPVAGTGCARARSCAAAAAARGRHVDVLQRSGLRDVARRHFHDHVVLVQLGVDGGDLALAEAVVQRVVDVARADAQARGAVLVDGDEGLDAVLLLVGVDVGQRGCPSSRRPARGPQLQVGALSLLSVYW